MSNFDPNRKAQAEAKGRVYTGSRPAKTGADWIKQNNGSLAQDYSRFFTGRSKRPDNPTSSAAIPTTRSYTTANAPTAMQNHNATTTLKSNISNYLSRGSNTNQSTGQIQPLSASPSSTATNAGGTQIQQPGQQSPPINPHSTPPAPHNQNQPANNSLRGTMQGAYDRGELQPHQLQGAQKMLDGGANEADVRSKLSQAWHYNQWQNSKQNAGPNTTVTNGAPIKGQPNSYGHGVITKNPQAKPGEIAATVNSTWGKGSITFGGEPKGRGVNWAEPGKPDNWKTQRGGAWVNSGIAAPRKSPQQAIKEDIRRSLPTFYQDLNKLKQRKDPHAFPTNPTSIGELRRNEGNDPSLNSRMRLGKGDLHVIESQEAAAKAKEATPKSFTGSLRDELIRARDRAFLNQ